MGDRRGEPGLHVLLPLPPLEASQSLNNCTVLEYGTAANSRFAEAQPVKSKLQKYRLCFGPVQENELILF